MSGPELHVSGGAGGTEARLSDLVMLARSSDDLALTLGAIGAECHGMLADPDVVASAALDPQGVATFEATLLSALDGPGGLIALSVGFGQRAIALRTVAASYQAVDEVNRLALDTVRWAVGDVLGDNAPISLWLLNALSEPLVVYELLGGEIDYERLLTDHPGIVDNLVGAGPGLITGLGGPPVDLPGAAHLVGLYYPDGNPKAVPAGIDTDASMTKPPGGFEDLMDGLARRHIRSPVGAPDQIDVRVITHADGSRAYIVDLPGTKAWNLPGGVDTALNDAGTNVHAMGGDVTTRQKAIAEALHLAGANSTDPVMLIGHSQGGIVAAQIAQAAGTSDFNYNVTHVVTAGAPIARIDIPNNVQVLALENSHDIVPHLDAADNPDRPNLTTVTFDNQQGTIVGDHSIEQVYVPAAQALDTSTDPSVTAYRDSAGAFLSAAGDGTTVQANVYNLSRVP